MVSDVIALLGKERIYPDTKLIDAMDLLERSPAGAILATQRDGAPFGILSERLVRQLVAEELLAIRLPAREQ
jgi:CBS domain-containing protein